MRTKREKRYIKICLCIIGFLLIVYYGLQWNQSIAVTTFRPMVRKFENTLISYKTGNYNVLETENFIIRYDYLEEDLLKLISKTAEDKYKELVKIFQYHKKDKILLVVYNDSDIFMNTIMLKKGTPPMGVYYGNSIHILNPSYWINDREDMEHMFYFEGPILHELTHLFIDHTGKGNFPTWFTEGVSLYFEYRIDGYEWGREVVFEDNKYTLDRLTNDFYSLNEYKAYTKSFRIIKNFVDQHGMNRLLKMIEALGKGENLMDYYYLFDEQTTLY
jgi:hypothetical protein